jgi:hypothetical protein
MKRLKTTPTFRSEEEEREFWDTHDSTEYIDWSKAEKVTFTNIKSSAEGISDTLLQQAEDVDASTIERVHKELKRVRSKL